jgi:hypothetical protein
MAVAVAYHVETAIWSTITFSYVVLFSGILLGFRFTPAKKRSDAKVTMVVLGFCSILLNIARCFDLSAVNGKIDFTTADFLHGLVTSFHLFALITFIQSLARSLYTQMQQPVPRFYSIALVSAATFYVLATIILSAMTYGPYRNRDTERLSKLNALKQGAFYVAISSIASIEIVLFFRLRWRLMRFIATVETQNRNIAAASAASPKQMMKTHERKATGHPGIIVVSSEDAGSDPASPTNGGVDRSGAASPIPNDANGDESPGDEVKMSVMITSTKGASAPAPPVQQSSHEQRIAELRTAVKVLTGLSIAVVLLTVLCIGFNFTDLIDVINGKDLTIIQLYGNDPTDYVALHSLMPFVQQINLAIICWFGWTPWLWLPKYTRERNLNFWDVLLHGLATSQGSRTGGSRLEVSDKRGVNLPSRTNAGSSKVAPMATTTKGSANLTTTTVDPARGESIFLSPSPQPMQAWSSGNSANDPARSASPVPDRVDEDEEHGVHGEV